MTGVAHHINEMKRQHEVAVHVQVGIKLVPACACYMYYHALKLLDLSL